MLKYTLPEKQGGFFYSTATTMSREAKIKKNQKKFFILSFFKMMNNINIINDEITLKKEEKSELYIRIF